ncbi:MAG: ABC transporter ATP-binding protein [Gaiellaceae bacterium]
MQTVAVRTEGLGKRYLIGQRQPYTALRDAIAGAARAAIRRDGERRLRSHIWALRNVSFELQQGEILGLVGANGAGKTTLLKVLSRVTDPTEGRAVLSGRVGALLEVGTGFHPELTGRENVYLNGTILGMRKSEIRAKFDEIVGFSEVEKFIDTPVKFYSSGMYVRLAFAVAAYLEPEILFVDEVLAVGDAAFQRRCLGKMGEVASSGRTVVFVSHNMSAVARLCTRAFLLEGGHVTADGTPREVIERYLTQGAQRGGRVWENAIPGPFQPRAIRVRQRDEGTETVAVEEPFDIEFDYELTEDVRHLLVQLTLRSPDGAAILTSQDRDDADLDEASALRRAGRYRTVCTLPGDLLNEGSFVISVNVTTRPKVGHYFAEENAMAIDAFSLAGVGANVNAPVAGFVRPRLDWRIEELEPEWVSQPGS